MEIIVDDRERAIFPYLEDASNKYHIDYKIQRNEVGDYAICYKGYILKIIERKTWEDLSASMRDGRKENVQKLISVRNQTKCRLAYLIEGDATPSPTKCYGSLPVTNLRAHLDHLEDRDDIHVMYSKNLEYTAQRLFENAKNLSTLGTILADIDKLIADKAALKLATGGVEGIDDSKQSDKLQEKQQTNASSISINEQILRCLPGVGSVISSVLAEKGITLYGLYHGDYSSDTLSMYKYATGACIGLTKISQILNGVKKTFTSASEVSHKARIRILTVIPLISKATAEKILEDVNLLDIIDGNIATTDLAEIQKTAKTKLGKKAAENLIKYLSGKATVVGDAEDNNKEDNKEDNTEDNKEDNKENDEDVSAGIKTKPVVKTRSKPKTSAKTKAVPKAKAISKPKTKPKPKTKLTENLEDDLEDSNPNLDSNADLTTDINYEEDDLSTPYPDMDF